ncbi:hypothetical protein M0722_16285 [Microbacterium sp. KSW4-16]|uniref:hypothetical protein n=1 Tax=Microbacterium aurugineum TaxID=2851642 RepID=UPI0020BE7A8A|nr:hypothetical protein [Microbacterium aurugineum]MCK8468754.1 hypothetical protein [Microbacterium aurugineum]
MAADARTATRRYHRNTALMVLGLWAVILSASWVLSPRSFTDCTATVVYAAGALA